MSSHASWSRTSMPDLHSQAARAETTTVGGRAVLPKATLTKSERFHRGHFFYWGGFFRHCPGGHISAPSSRPMPAPGLAQVTWESHLGPAFRRSIFGASDLIGILGCFDRARQSRRLFNMFGGLVRLVVGLRQLWRRLLGPFFDCRLPRHFAFSVFPFTGFNTDPAN
jgi:hypothetical protein